MQHTDFKEWRLGKLTFKNQMMSNWFSENNQFYLIRKLGCLKENIIAAYLLGSTISIEFSDWQLY